MTSKKLNLKLLENIPEVGELYYKETSWQDGDETGSHVVFADVLAPFIKEQISNKNFKMVIRIFDFIELLLDLNDEYVTEVITLSLLESLIFDSEIENSSFIIYAKKKTLNSIKDLIQNI